MPASPPAAIAAFSYHHRERVCKASRIPAVPPRSGPRRGTAPAGSPSPPRTSPSTAGHRGHSSGHRVAQHSAQVPMCQPQLLGQAGAAHLGPGPGFPWRGAGCPVAGAPALGAIPAAELGRDRAVGAVRKGLEAAHRAELVARIPTRLGAVLPLICCPAGKGNGVRHLQLLTFLSCCGCLIPGAGSSSGRIPSPMAGVWKEMSFNVPPNPMILYIKIHIYI